MSAALSKCKESWKSAGVREESSAEREREREMSEKNSRDRAIPQGLQRSTVFREHMSAIWINASPLLSLKKLLCHAVSPSGRRLHHNNTLLLVFICLIFIQSAPKACYIGSWGLWASRETKSARKCDSESTETQSNSSMCQEAVGENPSAPMNHQQTEVEIEL